MIKASSIYQDVQQQVAKEENGNLTITDFNRLSKRAELRLLWWLSGDVKGGVLPEPYNSQKSREVLAPFVSVYKATPDGFNQIERPEDYYQYENMHTTLVSVDTDCDDDDLPCGEVKDYKGGRVSIKLMAGDKFHERENTYISSLKPSLRKPIAKQLGKKFEFLPEGIYGVYLEYLRYPVYAEIKPMVEPVFNEEIPNEITTSNYEWDENVRDILVYLIVDFYSVATREKGLKETNEMTNKGISK